jgi:hypothetical protein
MRSTTNAPWVVMPETRQTFAIDPDQCIVWLNRTAVVPEHRRADQFIASSEMARSGKSEPAFLPVKVTIFL